MQFHLWLTLYFFLEDLKSSLHLMWGSDFRPETQSRVSPDGASQVPLTLYFCIPRLGVDASQL